eukprot:1499228-Rhodomonas_salina.4
MTGGKGWTETSLPSIYLFILVSASWCCVPLASSSIPDLQIPRPNPCGEGKDSCDVDILGQAPSARELARQVARLDSNSQLSSTRSRRPQNQFINLPRVEHDTPLHSIRPSGMKASLWAKRAIAGITLPIVLCGVRD